jgi:hypothetical protein
MEKVFSDRQKFGRFYYRFPNGEAGTDVFDRTSDFLSMLFGAFDGGGLGAMRTLDGRRAKPAENYVLVTHGLIMRIFCMCYLRWTVSEFEQVWNPSNCEIWVLEKESTSGEYALNGWWRSSPLAGKFVDLKYGVNKSEPMPAHMKRPDSRIISPGPNCLRSAELDHLRDVSSRMPNETRAVRVQETVDRIRAWQ